LSVLRGDTVSIYTVRKSVGTFPIGVVGTFLIGCVGTSTGSVSGHFYLFPE
jgi:hypothetical protein